MISCSDVCEEIHDRLTALGFDIDSETEAQEHDDMMQALDQVIFVRASPRRCPACGHLTDLCVCVPVEEYDLG